MTVFITEFAYHGSPSKGMGGDVLPQLAGPIITQRKEYDTTTAKTHTFHPETTFFVMTKTGGIDSYFNFDPNGTSGLSSAGSRSHWYSNIPMYQGVVGKDGVREITKMNIADV